MKLVLDTNSLIYYYNLGLRKFSEEVVSIMAESDLYFSASSLFELEYIYLKKRIIVSPDALIGRLTNEIDLLESQSSLSEVVRHSRNLSWTKDPFDRLIVGDAMALGAQLVTSDRLILQNFNQAIW